MCTSICMDMDGMDRVGDSRERQTQEREAVLFFMPRPPPTRCFANYSSGRSRGKAVESRWAGGGYYFICAVETTIAGRRPGQILPSLVEKLEINESCHLGVGSKSDMESVHY